MKSPGQCCEVIIFDEATSSLDDATEDAVMEAINNIGDEVTVLIVAHRLTTLKNCDLVVKIHNGEILNVGTYNHNTPSRVVIVIGMGMHPFKTFSLIAPFGKHIFY